MSEHAMLSYLGAASEIERLRAEIERLRAALKGAEIALARDANIDGAMRCILSVEQSMTEKTDG